VRKGMLVLCTSSYTIYFNVNGGVSGCTNSYVKSGGMEQNWGRLCSCPHPKTATGRDDIGRTDAHWKFVKIRGQHTWAVGSCHRPA